MTPQELLIPRFKVIADYPYSPFKVGEILTPGEENGTVFVTEGIEKYPHLFRPMHWAEERAVEDMPEYMKCFGTVSKVVAHFCDAEIVKIIMVGHFKSHDREVGYEDCLPATETDYLTYKNKNK